MPARLAAVAFAAADPAASARFWGALLDREPEQEPSGVLLSGGPTQVGLRFVTDPDVPVAGSAPQRLHLHLTSASLRDQEDTVERALDLGARHLDVGQRPEEDHVVLADPEGDAFCVVGPGNTFLAGCGRLGEVACDGTREVGLFWHDVLEWPLVWDHDQETAIQSPAGGTKIAWGGPPVPARVGRSRQRFELVAADVEAEVARLLSLGATRLADHEEAVELADPDGNEFRLRGRPG